MCNCSRLERGTGPLVICSVTDHQNMCVHGARNARCTCACRLCASNADCRGMDRHNTAHHICKVLPSHIAKEPLQLATPLPSRPGARASLQKRERVACSTNSTPTGAGVCSFLRHLPYSPPLTSQTHTHTQPCPIFPHTPYSTHTIYSPPNSVGTCAASRRPGAPSFDAPQRQLAGGSMPQHAPSP